MTEEIRETGLSWDHDTGDVCISTRSQKVANRLRKLGFAPEDPDSKDYLTFRAKDSELRVRFGRKRPQSEAQKAALRLAHEGLKRSQMQPKISQEGYRIAPDTPAYIPMGEET